jgi:hypothetical protein
MRRRSLNKVWILALALLVALGAMGVTYSAWTDEIYIAGTLATSGINATLDCGSCWETVDNAIIDIPDTSIMCTEDGQLAITIDIDNALAVNNHTDLLPVDYYCSFTISNPAGSLPVKIQSFTPTPAGSYPDVSAVLTNGAGDVQVGDVIDPGDFATGKVHISLTSFASENLDLTYNPTFNLVRWNQ